MPTRRLGALLLSEQSAPSTPASGYGVLYPKSDGFWYIKDDGGTERRIDITTHGGLSGIGANDHHNQSHNHSASGDGQTLSPVTLNIPTGGSAPTADGQARWNSSIEVLEVGDGSATKPLWPDVARGCRLRRVATQTINNNTQTTVSWDTEDADSDGFWVVGSPTAVAIPTGLGANYAMTLKVSLSGSGGTAGYLNIFDGTLNHRIAFASGQTTSAFSMAGVTLADAAALTFSCLHNNGSNLTMTAWLWLVRVGAGI